MATKKDKYYCCDLRVWPEEGSYEPLKIALYAVDYDGNGDLDDTTRRELCRTSYEALHIREPEFSARFDKVISRNPDAVSAINDWIKSELGWLPEYEFQDNYKDEYYFCDPCVWPDDGNAITGLEPMQIALYAVGYDDEGDLDDTTRRELCRTSYEALNIEEPDVCSNITRAVSRNPAAVNAINDWIKSKLGWLPEYEFDEHLPLCSEQEQREIEQQHLQEEEEFEI